MGSPNRIGSSGEHMAVMQHLQAVGHVTRLFNAYQIEPEKTLELDIYNALNRVYHSEAVIGAATTDYMAAFPEAVKLFIPIITEKISTSYIKGDLYTCLSLIALRHELSQIVPDVPLTEPSIIPDFAIIESIKGGPLEQLYAKVAHLIPSIAQKNKIADETRRGVKTALTS